MIFHRWLEFTKTRFEFHWIKKINCYHWLSVDGRAVYTWHQTSKSINDEMLEILKRTKIDLPCNQNSTMPFIISIKCQIGHWKKVCSCGCHGVGSMQWVQISRDFCQIWRNFCAQIKSSLNLNLRPILATQLMLSSNDRLFRNTSFSYVATVDINR